jgi:hypothetical protein
MSSFIGKVHAAVMGNCSTRTVERAIRDGQLRALKEPRKVLIAPGDAKDWIERRRGRRYRDPLEAALHAVLAHTERKLRELGASL